MRGLAGKRAIVTGAGGAIGRAIALRLAEEGAIAGVFDKNGTAADETRRMIVEAGGKAEVGVVDVTDHGEVRRCVAAFEAAAGPTDVLVNNAGWDRAILFLDTEPAFWDQVLAINLRGALSTTHAVARGMAERGRGAMVNVASDAGRVGSSGEAVYSAAKGGLIAFTKALARELAAKGVRANCVAPGPTDTPLFASFLGEGRDGQRIFEGLKRSIPMKRIGAPEDVAGIVAFLASDDAAYITGQVISVSGGLTMHG